MRFFLFSFCFYLGGLILYAMYCHIVWKQHAQRIRTRNEERKTSTACNNVRIRSEYRNVESRNKNGRGKKHSGIQSVAVTKRCDCTYLAGVCVRLSDEIIDFSWHSIKMLNNHRVVCAFNFISHSCEAVFHFISIFGFIFCRFIRRFYVVFVLISNSINSDVCLP